MHTEHRGVKPSHHLEGVGKRHQRERVEVEKAELVSPQEGVQFQEKEEGEGSQAPEQAEERGVPGERKVKPSALGMVLLQFGVVKKPEGTPGVMSWK